MSRHSGARPKGASPESIATIVGMDSEPAPQKGASRNDEKSFLTRRRFLASAAASLAPAVVQAQPRQPSPAEFSVAAPVAIEVNARPIPSFESRDRARVRFGALEYRSGLILTSSFRGFGGLSGWRFDTNGERFISISDKGSWFTGRIVYDGAATGLTHALLVDVYGPEIEDAFGQGELP